MHLYNLRGGNSRTISFVTIGCLLVTWWLVTEFQFVAPLFLPPPSAVLARFISIFNTEVSGATLIGHTLASLARVLTAFMLACVIGIPVGLLMGMNRLARGVCDPLVEFYRPIPPLAYLPLIVIWLGIGEGAKIILIFLAILAPIAMSAQAGVRSVPHDRVYAALSMGATPNQVFWNVVFRSALPEIFTGMRVGIGFGWTTLVAGEMIASKAGLGHMVLDAANYLNTDVVVMGIMVIGLVAYGLDLLMRSIEAKFVPWKGKV